MAKAAETFDVWFVKADTVYRGVPYGVVTDWAQQGRVAGDDRVRPAGSQAAWANVADHPLLSDFLFRGNPVEVGDLAEQLHWVDMDTEFKMKRDDDHDDPDMIPLIDISLVLLIFFMMTTAVAALSPVDVPEMKHGSKMEADPNAFSVVIDKRGAGEVYFALRIGKKPPANEDNNLATPEDVLRRLDARLAETQTPPSVLILCNKELERGWVRDIARELDKRKQKGLIAYYGAEVMERNQ